jgi:hypothetical protein
MTTPSTSPAASDNVRSASRSDTSAPAADRLATSGARANDATAVRSAATGGVRAERAGPPIDVLVSPWGSGDAFANENISPDQAAIGADAAAADSDAELRAPLGGAGAASPMSGEGVQNEASVSDVIDFNPAVGVGDPSMQRVLRLEFAQAAATAVAVDATASGGVLAMAPYQLALGGLALGVAAGGMAGGGGGGSGGQENFVWGGGNLNIVTPGGTVVTVETPAGSSGGSLTLSGGSAVNVNGLIGSRSINATNLSGNLTVNVVDDGSAGSLAVSTGSGALAINSADARDSLVIDAAALPGSATISLNGRLLDARVSTLAGSVNASGLDAGSLTVSTASPSSGQQRSLRIQTGAGVTQVNGSEGDTIIIDAERLADETLLKTTGMASFTITNLMGNLENSASGTVSATLDNDPEPGAPLKTTIRSSSAITVNNGTLDTNDTIILDGAGRFTVNGLVAKLDAGKATGPTSVTVAPVLGADVIMIDTGSASTMVTGTGALSRITIDASKIPDNTALTVRDSGNFTVTGLRGDLVATGAQNPITVSTAHSSGEVQVALGVAGGQVNASASTKIDALAMSNSSTLTIGAPVVAGIASGSVTVDGLSGKLNNQGTGEATVNLVKAAGLAATTVTVASNSILNVANGSLTSTDTIKLSGAGVFGVTGLAANLDGSDVSATLGAITATLNTDSPVDLKLSPGASDVVYLNGRNTTASISEVEILNVRVGGNISGAAITDGSAAVSPGQISGTKIDFADQSATLVLSVAQHSAIRDGNLITASQADINIQTLALSTGGNIGQTIPNIDVYQLSAVGSTVPVTIKSTGYTVNNDVQQQFSVLSPQTIKGSSGVDVVRTAAPDLIRGGLTIELGADLKTDYLFVNNSLIGNTGFQGLNATNGFGGRVKEYSSGASAFYANGTSIEETASLWKQSSGSAMPVGQLSAGVQAATVQGFQPSTDRLVYLEASEAAVTVGGYWALSSVPGSGAFTPRINSVIELESEFVAAAGTSAAAIGANPRDLEKIAKFLDFIPSFNDNGVDGGFYVIVYDYAQVDAADAWLYAATSTQNDGFDFADNPGGSVRDTDTLELIAIFKGVGVNAFTTDNFV